MPGKSSRDEESIYAVDHVEGGEKVIEVCRVAGSACLDVLDGAIAAASADAAACRAR
jgi:hypothetical protein